MIFALLKRELGLSFHSVGNTLSIVLFFLFVLLLFPFAVGPDSELLRRIAPGVFWVAAMLSIQLSLSGLFQADYDDGSLDQLVLSPLVIEWTVGIKIFVHWLFTALPLLAVLPFAGLAMGLERDVIILLAVSLLIGTPALSALGAMGAALALSARRSSVLIPLLITPLVIPTLIFGVASVDATINGFASRPILMVLAAISLFSVPVGVIASALAVKQAVD